MFNLDQIYGTYLTSDKRFRIDGVGEKVIAYGYNCDGSDIVGHYVTTENHRLYYDMKGVFIRKETLESLSTSNK
tara:strand:+ start:1032 stop:1253 length:222 start_codon:yes stop_codon:yes gene_type:complete